MYIDFVVLCCGYIGFDHVVVNNVIYFCLFILLYCGYFGIGLVFHVNIVLTVNF